MKFLYGLSAALLGATLLAGPAAAADSKDNSPPPRHPHFNAQGRAHGAEDIVRTTGNPTGRPMGIAPQYNAHPNFGAKPKVNFAAQSGNRGTWRNGQHGSFQPHWNNNNLHDHNVAHFNAQDRSAWQHGRWQHGRHHGRNGWWWNSGGSWFLYDQPVYPYPGYASNTYYSDDYYDDDDGDDGYAGDADPGYSASPADGGYYWYYCDNPAGYYPYVKSCRGPWRAVAPTPDASQQGYDQNGGPDADDGGDRNPPPGYNDNGPRGGDQINGPDNDDRGPPPDDNDNGAPR